MCAEDNISRLRLNCERRPDNTCCLRVRRRWHWRWRNQQRRLEMLGVWLNFRRKPEDGWRRLFGQFGRSSRRNGNKGGGGGGGKVSGGSEGESEQRFVLRASESYSSRPFLACVMRNAQGVMQRACEKKHARKRSGGRCCGNGNKLKRAQISSLTENKGAR